MENRITIIEKDITTIESGIICHQVNCQGRMGSGVALSIAKKWPKVETEYKMLCDRAHPLHSLLGIYQLCKVSNDRHPLYVCNIFGQNRYGTPTSGTQYTNYDAVAEAFKGLGELIQDNDDMEFYLQSVYIPWKMGCYRGGGNWDMYKTIIERYIPYKIIYCKWKG